ncbi:hypothetical protein [Staphylococcus pseudintermedius]|uniref:hypothetical protein n=1 Tax=Staphylococcus pseudintermedius TaxID=283734 RepID=UPI002032882F|nr:hypothetical protein [Staphylococcus pseudintermedius]
MSFRTVIITKESKLSLRMNQLIVKSENLSRIPLNEILCLVIEHPNVSMTGHLSAPGMGNILTVKVRYRLGSRNC